MDTKELIRTRITARALPLPGNEIDTDRIIPARYMKSVTFDGLEDYAFYDARFTAEGKPKEHPFNDKRYAGAGILLVGQNFGCGSSREHAPQALLRYGIRALIGESFAEIFAGNCTTMGIPTVTLPAAEIAALMQRVTADPQLELCLNLEAKTITAADKSYPAGIKESARRALVTGDWDSTALLLQNKEKILDMYEILPYLNGF